MQLGTDGDCSRWRSEADRAGARRETSAITGTYEALELVTQIKRIQRSRRYPCARDDTLVDIR